MKTGRKFYTKTHLISAVGMIVALVWLTVSTPFVTASQQQWSKQHASDTAAPLAGTEEESSCPFGNGTEEKAPSGSNFSEEYLHDHFCTHSVFSNTLTYQKCEDDGPYEAYHGETLVPPPNKA